MHEEENNHFNQEFEGGEEENQENTHKDSTLSLSSFSFKNFYELGGAFLVALAFLIPIFFIPSRFFDFTTGKMVLLIVFVLVGLFLAVTLILKKGKAAIPFHPVFAAALAIPVVYFISGIFSVSGLTLSVAGYGSETYSFAALLFFIILFFLSSFYFQKNNHIFYFYLSLLASATILTLFLITRLILGTDFLSFGFFNNLSSTPVESWNAIGILFGIILILAVFTLEMFKLKPAFRWSLVSTILVSFFFLIITGMVWLWVSIALIILGFIIYQMMDKNSGSEELNIPTVSLVSLFVVLSLVFFGGPFSDMLSETMELQEDRVNLTHSSTLEVAKQTLYHEGSLTNFLIGAGPVDFSYQWGKYKPDDVLASRFWNVDFNQGSSYFSSMPVTVGVVGVLTWMAFVILLLYLIYRGLTKSFEDKITRYVFISSSAITALLLVSMLVTVVPVALLTIFFISAAIPVGILIRENRIKLIPLELNKNDQNGSLYIILLIVVSGVLVLFGMFLIQRAVSAVFFEKAANAFYRERDVETAEFNFVWATNLSSQDRYYRIASEFPLDSIRQRVSALQSGDISQEEFSQLSVSDLRQSLSRATLATELNKRGYRNWLQLGQIYQEMFVFNFEDIDPYTLSKEAYEEALENNPKNPSILLQKARLEFLADNFEEARQYNEKALEMKPNYANSIFFNSRLAIEAGDLEEAKEFIIRAINLEPFDPGLHFQLGILRYEENDMERAVRSLTSAVLLSPRFDNARYFLSLALYQTGESEQAIDLMDDLASRYEETDQLRKVVDNMRAGEVDPMEGVGEFDEPTPEMPIEEDIPDADSDETISPEDIDDLEDPEDLEEGDE